jgi:hypothetical protein
MKNDTFTLWGLVNETTGKVDDTFCTRSAARAWCEDRERVVKLSCQIVPQKPKRKKHNFGLPAGMTPHNPDNLTPEQVGEGFRLLAREEIWERPSACQEIECYGDICKEWDATGWRGASTIFTYRVPADWPLDINPELK